MRESRIITVLALLLAALLSPVLAEDATETRYSDVAQEEWYYEAVEFVSANELFTGVTEKEFVPDGDMTRAMFVTVLLRLDGTDATEQGPMLYDDVPAGMWYSGSVEKARSMGLLADYPSSFSPNAPITRVECCRLFAAYCRCRDYFSAFSGGSCGFLDCAALSSDAQSDIALLQSAGIVSGFGDGSFAPQLCVTRAEAAQMFKSLYEAISRELTTVSLEDFPAGGGRWSGLYKKDFPLSQLGSVTSEDVEALNRLILSENRPTQIAAARTSLDGNMRHLTNYGSGGVFDCKNVVTQLKNNTSGEYRDVQLSGRSSYYGYVLQIEDTACQDKWHSSAVETGKNVWQCTWWAWGRADQYMSERYGVSMATACQGKTVHGHGGNFFASLSSYFRCDGEAAANCLVVWRGGSYGHVGYVEAVDEGGIWVSQADSGRAWRGITYIPAQDGTYPLGWYKTESFQGFVHLDDCDWAGAREYLSALDEQERLGVSAG